MLGRQSRLVLVAVALILPLVTQSVASIGAPDDARGNSGNDVLVLFFEKVTLAFQHTRYHQYVDGFRVLDAGATLHEGTRGSGLRVTSNDLAETSTRSGAFVLTDAAAEAVALGHVSLAPNSRDGDASVERVWAQTSDGLRLAFLVEIDTLIPPASWRVIIDGTTGRVLEARDETLSYSMSARVFRDNPIVALQDGAFRDNLAGVDDGSFEKAFTDVTLSNLTGNRLATPHINIVDALTVPAPGLDASFDRADPRFTEIMVLYYMQHALDRLAAVGYPDIIPHEVNVVSHAPLPWFGPDAITRDERTIIFFYRTPTPNGMGSSAEDAEIIVHELGHVIHIVGAPGTSGKLWGAFAEGTGDILASLVLDDVTRGFGDACIFEWVTSYYGKSVSTPYNGLDCIRVLDNNLTWPADAFGEVHRDGQFWAGALYDISRVIGSNETLVLLTEAIHLMPTKIDSFEIMGNAVLLADLGLTGGERHELIRDSFARKGITVGDGMNASAISAPPVTTSAKVPATNATESESSATDPPTNVPTSSAFAVIAVVGFVALARHARRRY